MGLAAGHALETFCFWLAQRSMAQVCALSVEPSGVSYPGACSMIAMDWRLPITSAAVHHQNYKHQSQACPLLALVNASWLQTKQPRPTPVSSNVAIKTLYSMFDEAKISKSYMKQWRFVEMRGCFDHDIRRVVAANVRRTSWSSARSSGEM